MEYVNLTETSGYAGDGKAKIYAFVEADFWGDYAVVALDDKGEYLAGHICSHPTYGPGDIGCRARDWSGKRKVYEQKYPSGYSLEWVENPGSHEGLQAIVQKMEAERD